jgi:hypothetical protein
MSAIQTITRRVALLAFATAMLAGCGTVVTGATDVDKSAFGEKKRYAVVTIASMKNFSGERSIFQAFKDPDDIPGANTQQMIDKLAPRIIATLGKSTRFSLLPETRVLSSRAYRSAAEDPKVVRVAMFTADMNVARGYRYLSEPQKFATLAQELGVDGVIAVQVHFNVSSGTMGMGLAGMAFGRKTYSASATASAVAYNQKGEVVWKDTTTKQAEPGDARAIVVVDTSGFTGADFQKMQPSAVEMGAKAIDVLLARFDDTMAGVQVERVQSVK